MRFSIVTAGAYGIDLIAGTGAVRSAIQFGVLP